MTQQPNSSDNGSLLATGAIVIGALLGGQQSAGQALDAWEALSWILVVIAATIICAKIPGSRVFNVFIWCCAAFAFSFVGNVFMHGNLT